MDKSTANEYIENIGKFLVDRLEKTEKFVIEQAPEVIQQLVAWEVMELTKTLWQNLFGLIIAITSFILCLWACLSHLHSESNSGGEGIMILSGVGAFVALVFAGIIPFVIVDTYIDIYKIKTYPKAFLFKLLKKGLR